MEKNQKRLLRDDVCSSAGCSTSTFSSSGFPDGNSSSGSEGSEVREEKLVGEVMEKLKELSDESGMPVKQESGQRSYGPPLDWKGPPPPKGSEVFVGKLPRRVFEPHLIPLFEKIGPIYELRMMIDFKGTNRGFCFVQFTRPEDAERAIKELNNHEIIPGQRIGVVKSLDNARLFVGGIPFSKTEAEIHAEIDKITEGVSKVILPPPNDAANALKKNRGYAFVEYESHKAACLARRKLLPNAAKLWGDREISVDWAYEGTEIRTLHVQNLHPMTTGESLKAAFDRIGNNGGVVNVKMFRSYCFIEFTTREQAFLAKNELDGTVIDGNRVRVNWAKPAMGMYQKNTAKGQNNRGRSDFCVKKNYSCPNQFPRSYQPPTAASNSSTTAAIFKSHRFPSRSHSFPQLDSGGNPPSYANNGLLPYGQPYMPAAAAAAPSAFSGYNCDPVQSLVQLCTSQGWGYPAFIPLVIRQGGTLSYAITIYVSHHPNGPREFRTPDFYRTVDEAQVAAALGMYQILSNELAAMYASGSQEREPWAQGVVPPRFHHRRHHHQQQQRGDWMRR